MKLSLDPAQEVLFGSRGVVKANPIWLSLALPLAVDPRACGPALALLAAAACWAQACILANDLSDSDADLAAGKRRWIVHLGPRAGLVVVALMSAGGGAALLIGAASPGALAVYVGALALGLLYSLRPPRFKERGLWGPASYGLSCALAYAALPWAWLGQDWRSLAVLAPAVLLDSWVKLQFHQILDYASDSQRGEKTHAVCVGLPRAQGQLAAAANVSAAWSAAALAFVLLILPGGRGFETAGCALVLLAAGGYVRMTRRGLGTGTSLTRELPWPYLATTLVLLRLLPLLILARLAFSAPAARGTFILAATMILRESWLMLRYG